jgi:L-rhamnose 1-dehydrogenase
VLCSALEFAKQGASGLILHYLGDDETEREVRSLKTEVEGYGASAIAVAGDIADLETTRKVRRVVIYQNKIKSYHPK